MKWPLEGSTPAEGSTVPLGAEEAWILAPVLPCKVIPSVRPEYSQSENHKGQVTWWPEVFFLLMRF